MIYFPDDILYPYLLSCEGNTHVWEARGMERQ